MADHADLSAASRILLAAGLLALCACGSSDNGSGDYGPSSPEFQNFRSVVEADAGEGATDCGHANLDEDRSTLNCCLTAEYSNGAPAFATYESNSIDSYVVLAYAADSAGGVTRFALNQIPVPPYQASVSESECAAPIPNPFACSQSSAQPFVCF